MAARIAKLVLFFTKTAVIVNAVEQEHHINPWPPTSDIFLFASLKDTVFSGTSLVCRNEDVP